MATLLTADSTEGKLSQVEKFLQRALIAKKSIKAQVPPIPLFWSYKQTPEDGQLGSFLLPCAGTLRQLLVKATFDKKLTPKVTVVIESATSSASYSWGIQPKLMVVGQELELKAGDILSLSVSEPVGAFHLSTLLDVDTNVSKLYSVLIDDLLADEES